jgi:hypothetical protein
MDASDGDGRRATELLGPSRKEIEASEVREAAMNAIAGWRSVEPNLRAVIIGIVIIQSRTSQSRLEGLSC